VKKYYFPAVVLLFTSCAAGTIYHFEIDFFSFLSSEERQMRFFVPEETGAQLYFFPSVYLDLNGSGPDEAHRKGVEINLAATEVPDQVRLYLKFSCSIILKNISEDKTIPDASLSFIASGKDTENIYESGTVLFSTSLSEIQGGQEGAIRSLITITQGSSGYDILSSGSFLLGCAVMISPAQEGGEVEVLYSMDQCSIFFGGYPFGFIP